MEMERRKTMVVSDKTLLSRFPNVYTPVELEAAKKKMGFANLMDQFGVPIHGRLSCGEEWELLESRKGAPGLFWGIHGIVQVNEGLMVKDAKKELLSELSVEAFIISRMISKKINPIPGSSKVEVNGEGLVSRPWLHFHVICPTVLDILNYSVIRDDFLQNAELISQHMKENTRPTEIPEKIREKLLALL